MTHVKKGPMRARREVRAAHEPEQNTSWLDGFGVGLIIAWILWLSGWWGLAGPTLPVIALIIACAMSYAIARWVGRRWRWFVPALVVVAAACGIALAGREVYGRSPLALPLGYANANAAFYAQAAIASLLLGFSTRGWAGRLAGGLLASGFALVPLLNGSLAGVLTLGCLLPLAAGLTRTAGVGAAARACGAIWLVVVLSTVVLGVAQGRGNESLGAPAASALSELRLELWHDALTLAAEHPLKGVGPGSFAAESRTARADADAAMAHNEYLQHAAEAGITAFVMFAAVIVWGLVRIAGARAPDGQRALALTSWTMLAVHASVDYVLHFGAIPIVAAALAGSGTADSPTTTLSD